ncbi:hypothetical protein B0H21DRAFT_780701 [Amylocystis lapponica]|nr:hypothetical protein B0H21DRAFT_780701 [Amylocystis lapponica]
MNSSTTPPPSPLFARFPSRSSSPRTMPLRVSDVANIFVKMRRHQARSKANRIESSSGEPQTHPTLDGDGFVSEYKVPLVKEDRLATRAALYETAQALGGNVLVDEQWMCTVCEAPRNRNGGSFRVNVHYTASAARSERRDPQRPVALDRARGVPGLMTIVSRHD